jgi:hypothetical protein
MPRCVVTNCFKSKAIIDSCINDSIYDGKITKSKFIHTTTCEMHHWWCIWIENVIAFALRTHHCLEIKTKFPKFTQSIQRHLKTTKKKQRGR